MVLCNCRDPAKFLSVNKEGPNKGRNFYACAKPQWADKPEWADKGDTGPPAGGGGYGGGGGGGSSGRGRDRGGARGETVNF